MKVYNSMKLASSFREISNALDVISVIIRIFAIALTITQSLILIKKAKAK